MTAKADEPRTTMKIPVSLREIIRVRAQDRKMTMMDYIIQLVNENPGCEAK